MQIKRFEARDLTEALNMIKDEFGPEAVILSASKRNGGWLGFLKKPGVVVTAATDIYRPGLDPKRIEAPKGNGSKKPENGSMGNGNVASPSLSYPLHKYAVNNAKEKNTPGPVKNVSGESAALALKKLLISHGMSVSLVSEMVDRVSIIVRNHLKTDEGTLKSLLVRAMKEAGITVSKPITVEPEARKIVVMAGPTGVGKTMTIAKIAAVFARRKRESVSLVTIDRERIGAVEQLRRYAGIIGVPFYAASDKEELRAAIAATPQTGLVLVDTPGLSPLDKEGIGRLNQILSVIPFRSTCLLISAATRDADFNTVREGFEPLSIDSLIYTKTDETAIYGSILTQLIQSRMPVLYLTTGRRIPEDFKAADMNVLAELFISGEETLLLTAPTLETEKKILPIKPVVPKKWVANRNSDIYHLSDCRSASKISVENRVEFETPEEAKRQNFSPCKLCCHKPAEIIPEPAAVNEIKPEVMSVFQTAGSHTSPNH